MKPLVCLTTSSLRMHIIFIAARRRQIYAADGLRASRAAYHMLEFPVYLLYRAFFALLNALPLRCLFAIGELLGLCAWLLSPKYRRLALRNVAIAFGEEKSPTELRLL